MYKHFPHGYVFFYGFFIYEIYLLIHEVDTIETYSHLSSSEYIAIHNTIITLFRNKNVD